jgi:hypothetical protein
MNYSSQVPGLAGISLRHDFLDITPEEWDAVLGVNLTGIFKRHAVGRFRRYPDRREADLPVVWREQNGERKLRLGVVA